MSLELMKKSSGTVPNPDNGSVTVFPNLSGIFRVRESDGTERDLVPRYYDTSGFASDYYRRPVNFVVQTLPETGIEGARYLCLEDNGIYTYVNSVFVPDAPPVLGCVVANIGEMSDLFDMAVFLNASYALNIDTPFYSADMKTINVVRWQDRLVVFRKKSDGSVYDAITVDANGDIDRIVDVFSGKSISSAAVDSNGNMWVICHAIEADYLGGSGTDFVGDGIAEIYKFEYNQSTFPFTVYKFSDGSFPSRSAELISAFGDNLVFVGNETGLLSWDDLTFGSALKGGETDIYTLSISGNGINGTNVTIEWRGKTGQPAFAWNAGTSKWDAVDVDMTDFGVSGTDPVVAKSYIIVKSVSNYSQRAVIMYEPTQAGWRWNNLTTTFATDLSITDPALEVGHISWNRIVSGSMLYMSTVSASPQYIEFDGTKFIYVAVNVTNNWDTRDKVAAAFIYDDGTFLWIASKSDTDAYNGVYRVTKSTSAYSRFEAGSTARVFVDVDSDSTLSVYSIVTLLDGSDKYSSFKKYNRGLGAFQTMTSVNSALESLAKALDNAGISIDTLLGLDVALPFVTGFEGLSGQYVMMYDTVAFVVGFSPRWVIQ